MVVRDAVHGDVELDKLQAAVLDFPEVQRLRGIKQLGTASFVYPGAVHTRFDHSLGTCATAQRLLAALQTRHAREVSPALASLIGAAALLHDVTHVPFGHTFEDERRLFPRHDKGQRLALLFSGHLGEELHRLGIAEPMEELLGLREYRHVPPWARQIVASTIDADLLDYLRRDAYFTGLAQRYDERVFRSFEIAGNQLALALTRHGMVRPDTFSETVQLLRLRYFLTERVYYHHTKVAAGAMISKAVELAQQHGHLSEAELLQLHDASLFERLKEIPSRQQPDPNIVRLVQRLERRQLLKRGYVLSAARLTRAQRSALVRRYHESAEERRIAEGHIASELRCNPGEVIVYCPALTSMKEASALAITPTGVEPLDRYDQSGEIHALQRRYEELWRFYVFVPAEFQAVAAEVAAEYFGYPSEHQPRRGN
ncbi:MAG: HD domain-containing protein [Candidatus Binatia bacterium]|nr:HD domain-containing protein [Candidatus Binatia bacterium]